MGGGRKVGAVAVHPGEPPASGIAFPQHHWQAESTGSNTPPEPDCRTFPPVCVRLPNLPRGLPRGVCPTAVDSPRWVAASGLQRHWVPGALGRVIGGVEAALGFTAETAARRVVAAVRASH
eukprot:9502083-Pyramimonas_sp.AAC.1